MNKNTKLDTLRTGRGPGRSFALASGLLIAAATANAVNLPFHDPFDYSEGRLNDVSANWTAGSTGAEISVSNAASLFAPPGYAAASGRGVRRAPSSTSRRSVLSFPAVTATDGNVIYVSFLLNVVTPPGSAQTLLHIDNASSSVTSPDMGFFLDNGPKVGIGKNASSPGFTMATNLGAGAHLIVGRYTFQSGNDRVDLWVDPDSSTYSAGGAPTPDGGATGSGDPSSIGFCQIVCPGTSGGVQYIDEFRIGTTWAEVVPSGGPVTGTKLAFTTQPVNGEPNVTLPQIVVQVQGASGAAAASNGVPVSLTLTSGSGTLSGTTTRNTDSTGKAIFDDLSLNTTGIKQLTAAASGIGTGLASALSSTFTINVQPVATKLAYAVQPLDAVINTTLNGINVQLQDDNNLPVASNAVPITLTLSSGSGNLNGTVTRNTDNTGKAVFNDLSIDDVGTKQLTASASDIGAGLPDAVSSFFNITLEPVGAKLAFTTQPANTPVGSPINNIVVQIQDAHSAAVPSNGVPVTLTLTLGTGALSGTTTQNTDSTGKATFTGLSINAAGPAKQLTASASGFGSGLASTPSAIFAITGTSAASAPVITQTVKTASSVILRGTNGTPGAEYRVLSSTNVAAPSAQWAAVATNNFTGTGSFASTNSTSPSTTREFFRLLSTASGGGVIDFSHIGFAGFDASGNPYNLTGGTNGSFPQNNIVIASNAATLGSAISNPAPMIILVQGEIYMRTNGNFYVQANKSIIGLGTNATLVGCLGLYGNAPGGHPTACSNIIIRNITLRNPDQFGEDDGITIKYGAHHIWIDHCTFHDVYDGTLDITRESDFVTVSWCKFFYNFVNSHGDTVNLLGGNDSDSSDIGKLHVTFHHNWWGPLCRERMPSVRFGRVHVFNNYFNSVGNHYCVRARLYSEVLVENNYFDTVYNPWELATSSLQASNALIRAVGNITNNCTFSTSHYNPSLPNSGVLILAPGTNTLSSGINQLNPPPYAYTPDPAIDVPAKVQANAGAGKGPFAP